MIANAAQMETLDMHDRRHKASPTVLDVITLARTTTMINNKRSTLALRTETLW